MLMNVVLYNFSKRINSTKQPSGGTTFDCELKERTSIENPILQVYTDISSVANITYAYIPTFGKYYYVTDISCITNDIVEINMSVDVLATYKTEIKNTSCYVEYANSTDYYNKMIPDKRISMSNDVIESTQFTDAIFSGGGSYIIGVAGESVGSQVGFINYYAMNSSSAHQLAQHLYSDDIRDYLDKYFNSPFDAIIEAHWVPWTITGPNVSVTLGGYSTNILGVGLSNEVMPVTTSKLIDIPWIYNDWRDFDPYSKLELYLPFYGVVTLDQNTLEGSTYIEVLITKDAISGELCYTVICGAWKSSYRVDISVPLAVGQTTSDKKSGITEVIGGVAGIGAGIASIALSGGATTPIVGGAIGIIGGTTAVADGTITAFKETTSSKGGQGGFARAYQTITHSNLMTIRLTLYSHLFSVSDPTDLQSTNGVPIFDVHSIGDFNGYVKCSGVSVGINGNEEEKTKVNNFLNNGGVFIE